MPATLHFSNSLDALADRLLENLTTAGGDPFAAPAIATPGPGLRDWLKIRLAEKTGIVAGTAFPHLEILLWNLLAERDPRRDAEDRKPAEMLDSFGFQGLVLATLRRDPPGELLEYVESGEPEDKARRLCQIAGRLASLFREYEYNRVEEHEYPGVTRSWMNGRACFADHLKRGREDHPGRKFSDEIKAMESWQMGIYQAIFRENDGLRDRWGKATGVYRYTLPQYAAMALEDPKVPAAAGGIRKYHLFGLSNISPFHRNLIGMLADGRKMKGGPVEFEIYALNPCAEFWEDAETPKERRARASGFQRIPPGVVKNAAVRKEHWQNAEIPDAERENGLLSLFGKPGRETLKLWCSLTDHDFHDGFREPEGTGLLAEIRRSVFHREGKSERTVGDDGPATLRIRCAPDARAEIEAVRAEMSRLLREDKDLRPEDMALIPADPESALPLIRAAFAGEREAPGNVPLLLPRGGSPEGNPLRNGFRMLLALGSDADRKDLLALLDNPAALRKSGLEAGRLPAVRGFLEAAGFQESWEDADGTKTLSTLRDAVERALLARYLDPEDSALEATGLRPARNLAGRLEHGEFAALIDWLERLRDALRPLRDGKERAFPEWAGILRNLFDGFLESGEDDEADARGLRSFFADLESWGRWEATAETAPFELMAMLFEDRFRGEGSGRIRYLQGGVRVGGLADLRGIPFRHAWVTGLAASVFPAPSEAAPLDLRAYRRLPGESDAAARDLYALLEVTASVTGTLSLSWPRRDPERDAGIPPSRALIGLTNWLESDLGVRIDWENQDKGLMPPPRPALPAPPEPAVRWAETPKADASFATWDELADYLRNPAWYTATRRFGLKAWDALDESEEERAAALFLGGRARKALIDAALREELRLAGTGAETFSRLWRDLVTGGQAPPPPYRELEENSLREELDEQVTACAEALGSSGLELAGSLRLGPQGFEAPDPPVRTFPAFDATPLEIPARAGGILPWFFLGKGGWGLLVEAGKEFPAYLLQLCAAALAVPRGMEDKLRGTATLFVRDKGTIQSHRLPGFGKREAGIILRDLLGDFLRAREETDSDDLPMNVIADIHGRAGKQGTLKEVDWREEVAEERRENEENPAAHAGFNDRLLRTLGPSVPEDAEEKIRRRILPYLEWKNGWEKA